MPNIKPSLHWDRKLASNKRINVTPFGSAKQSMQESTLDNTYLSSGSLCQEDQMAPHPTQVLLDDQFA